MKHDDIVLELNNEMLNLLLYKYFDELKEISNLDLKNCLKIEKTFEFPVVKGKIDFRTIVGYIDLIVHTHPYSFTEKEIYDEEKAKEFIIEIKTENDFDDFGKILRQIKKYKTHYLNSSYFNKQFESGININSNYNKYFCLLSTKIPPKIKQLFEDEGILCFEISELIKKDIQHKNQ